MISQLARLTGAVVLACAGNVDITARLVAPGLAKWTRLVKDAHVKVD